MTRVLVIDDNAVNREYALQLLHGMGLQADHVPDGPTAVQVLQSTKYDLIFMDIRMPQMSGYEAAKYIRSIENPRQRTPIIAVTAYGGIDNHETNRESGINGFISKPLTVKKIESILRYWVEKRAGRIQRFIRKKKKFKFGLGHKPY